MTRFNYQGSLSNQVAWTPPITLRH